MLCPVLAKHSDCPCKHASKDSKTSSEADLFSPGADDRNASAELDCGNRVDVYSRTLQAWRRGREIVPQKAEHVTVEFQWCEHTFRKTCRPDSDSIWMPSPPPLVCAKLDQHCDRLSEYLLGGIIQVPAGYLLETDGGVSVLVHGVTGIRCCANTFSVGWHVEVKQPIVLYHYTTKFAFEAVAFSNCFHVSTQLGTDCDFGIGHYATSLPPHAFSAISEVLCNNYPRMLRTYGVGHPNFPRAERAEYCIPLVVDYDWLPALPLSNPSGPRGAVSEKRDRSGFEFDASRHNIWFVDKSKLDKFFHGIQDRLEMALLVGAQQGQADVVEACLRDGADIEAVDDRGTTALMFAAASGHVGVVRHLISASARVDATESFGKSAFILAAQMGNADVVDVLLSIGARLNVVDNAGRTPLIRACWQNENLDAIKMLLAARASLNAADAKGLTALMWAASYGAVAVVDALLESGASVRHIDADGYSAVSWASWCQDEDAKTTMLASLALGMEGTT